MKENEQSAWADALQQSANNLRAESKMLMKQARDLKAESERLRKLAVKARKKRGARRWQGKTK